jgi:hypothetical protein
LWLIGLAFVPDVFSANSVLGAPAFGSGGTQSGPNGFQQSQPGQSQPNQQSTVVDMNKIQSMMNGPNGDAIKNAMQEMLAGRKTAAEGTYLAVLVSYSFVYWRLETFHSCAFHYCLAFQGIPSAYRCQKLLLCSVSLYYQSFEEKPCG